MVGPLGGDRPSKEILMTPVARPEAACTPRRSRWIGQAGALCLALSAAVLAACGGGGDASSGSASASSGTVERATAFAAGPISGFGSVIVNGVRYDDSSATVTDDDGTSRTRDVLKLGMAVEVDGTAVSTATGTGKALRIRFGSALVGPVTAVDAAGSTVTVLGQVVKVSSTTVFDDSLVGGLSGLDTSDILEVHAQYNATDGSYSALRIEDAASATAFKLQGTVAALDTTAKTFTLGGQTVNYGSIASASVPSTLANGVRAAVKLQTTKVSGQWVATALRVAGSPPADGLTGHVRGPITVFTSTASFEINGLKVDASGASFPDGTSGIALGTVVEVKGAMNSGVLVATSVEIDSRHVADRHRFELHGTVSALDTTAKTFLLRGVTVSYGTATVTWKDGTEADLANGKKVEVQGTPSTDRTKLVASTIDYE